LQIGQIFVSVKNTDENKAPKQTERFIFGFAWNPERTTAAIVPSYWYCC